MERIEVDTSEYEMAHGKRPAGGNGWAFGFTRHARLEDLFWPRLPNGLPTPYSVAKKLAIAKAREIGAQVVYVQS